MELTPPSVPDGLVPRDRLLVRYEGAHARRLTLVVAPSGYGKTVLMSQWAARQEKRRVLWATLGSHARGGGRQAMRVFQALTPAEPWVGDGIRGDASGRILGSALLAALGRVADPSPTTLVLDEFDALTDPVALEVCTMVIESAPAWLQFVVISQAEPSLPYYRARLSGAVAELRQGDLEFSAEEAAQLVQQTAGFEIGAPQIEDLLERTEGWPVGLQIAANDIMNSSDVASAISRLDGSHTVVARYFEEHALRRRTEAEGRFLRATSVLDHMCGPLCDSILGIRQSDAILEGLERQSLFTTREVDRTGWFRYHRLFRAALRQKLRAEDTELERQLLQRAAEWHANHGDVDTSTIYFTQAGAWDRLFGQVQERGSRMLANQRGAEVVKWLAHIDPVVKEKRPDILALEASAMAMSGRIEGLDPVLRTLDASSSATRADRLIATVARSYGQLSRGASVEALSSAGQALSELRSLGDQDLPRWFRLTGSTADIAASAEIAKGLSHLWLADLAGARRALREVPTVAHTMWRSSAQGLLALCDALGARLSASDHSANRAFAIGAEPGGRDVPLVPAMLARALVASERDEVERALDLLADAESALEGSDRPIFSRWVAVERARLALAGGAPPQAMKILADEAGAGVQGPPLLATRTAVASARALIATGDLPAAARAIDRVRDFEGHEVFATRVRVLVETGDLAGARTLLKRWPDDAEPRGRLERTLWAAILSDAEGDTPAAVAAMSATVAECEIEGFLGLFRDAGPPALALARAVYRTAPSAFLRQVVERPVVPFHPRHPKGLIVPLTDREYAVLALLPTRLSYGEIADRLGISRNTVKTHLKHIYHKFNAVRRSEAISAAERLHLL